MLPADQLELLTAAVDGELTPPEALQLRRLLDGSAEARSVYALLKGDSDRLRALPPAAPPNDLRDRVLAALPVITPPLPAARRLAPRWAPLAVAASLLLAVTALSFWFFTRDDHAAAPGRGGPIAGKGDRPRPPNTAEIDPDWTAILPTEEGGPHPAPAPPRPADRGIARATPSPAAHPSAPALLPAPRPVDRDLAAFPPLPETAPFDLVQVRIPFLVPAADLDREDARQRLTEELIREPALRLDVFATDTARAAELLRTAARQTGLTVHTDAGAGDRIRNRRQPSGFLLYTEDLTPTQARDVLVRAATADAKAAEPVLDLVHLVPIQPADYRELRDVIGFDPGPWKKPAATDPKPAGKASGAALLMTHSPAQYRTAPGISKELKQYLEKRGDRKPTAVPVMIVIRQAG
jgi:anti-sigma factor RsiW